MRETAALGVRLRNTARVVCTVALTPVIFVFFTIVAIFLADADEV